MNARTNLLRLIAVLLLALATWGAYHRTFASPFIFDDLPSILENPSIRHLGALGEVLSPPSADGNSAAGRPLVNLSLAINYAISGTRVWSYHAFNLIIHFLAGLALWGVARRTLEKVGFADPFLSATAIALIWIVHPLQTEAVTCVVQRTESLMGLWYLLVLYCFIRSTDQALDSQRPWRPLWGALAVAACAAGMATKEVMVTAPVLVFLYDRTFVAGSFREAWRRHCGLHLALGATWLLLGALLIHLGGSRGATAGFGHGVTSAAYARTQCWAVVHYLRLSFWPNPLIVDYGNGLVPSLRAVGLQVAVVSALLAGTLVALVRKPALGFLGAWFFCILAPSSSFVPIVTQTIAERRMYLPLAAVITCVVAGARAWAGRRGLAVCFAAAIVLFCVTVRRNEDYRSAVAIWTDTVAKRPGNARAHNDLGDALRDAGNPAAALVQFSEAVRLEPTLAEAHYNLGNALVQTGRAAEALEPYRQALRLRPGFAQAHYALGGILLEQGQNAEALEHFSTALQLAPESFEAHYDTANALFHLGRSAQAADEYTRALAIRPDSVEAHYNLANALIQTERLGDAIVQFQAALRLRPDLADAHFNLAGAWMRTGHTEEAIRELREVLRLQPDSADARELLERLSQKL